MSSEEKKKNWTNCLFSESQGKISFQGDDFQRIETSLPMGCSKKVDHHMPSGMKVHFVQVPADNGPEEIVFGAEGEVFHSLHSIGMGILIRIRIQGQEYTAWFPPHAGQYGFDEHRRIFSDRRSAIFFQWEFPPYLTLSVKRPEIEGNIAVVSFVTIPDPTGQVFQELANLEDAEQCLYLKSEWFSANSPSDIWKYLIDGSIYDPRSDGNIGKQFRCQQCAYAWWTYFHLLYLKTGKKIYSLLQDQIAFTVLMEISPSGEWGHGFWSDDMETHARFHLDGLHLFISQYEKTGMPIWLEKAEKGMAFLSSHLMDEMEDGGIWFLHDTLELSSKAHHFQSSLYGKHQGNSLTLNTHISALIVLHRLGQVMPDEKKYDIMFEKGIKVLPKILENRSGEGFYKVVMPWLINNTAWVDCHSNVDRIVRGLQGRVIHLCYRILRRQFPRIVLPGGFIERDLTLSSFYHPYQNVTLKDLLFLYQQHPFPWLCSYIEDGIGQLVRFVQKVGVKNLLTLHPIYIETIEALYLFERAFGRQIPLNIHEFEKQMYQESGGTSLDYHYLKVVDALQSSTPSESKPEEYTASRIS